MCHADKLKKKVRIFSLLKLLIMNLVPQNLSVFHKWELSVYICQQSVHSVLPSRVHQHIAPTIPSAHPRFVHTFEKEKQFGAHYKPGKQLYQNSS